MSNTGWENVESKINEKTALRRQQREENKRARIAQLAKLRRWIFFSLEILLATIGFILLANYIAGKIHVIVFQALFSIITALMTFCAGYFLGATKH